MVIGTESDLIDALDDDLFLLRGPLYSVNQSGQTRTMVHDWLGRMTSETHPESGTTSYELYDDGPVFHRTDARGILTTYLYDNIDRSTSITYSDGTPSVSYAYDQGGTTGFLTTASNSLKTTTFTYNAGGQVAIEQSTIPGVTGTFTASYSYDRDGRITRITYPSGRVVQRSYQASGGTATDRINTIVDTTTSNTLVANVQDNPAGLVTGPGR